MDFTVSYRDALDRLRVRLNSILLNGILSEYVFGSTSAVFIGRNE